MYNDIAYLINKIDTGTVDEYEDTIFRDERTEIFVNVESVKRSEFYTAQTAGFNPQIVFSIQDYYDYNNQPLIEYEKNVYKIIRTYRTGIGLEIVCEHYE